MNACKCGAAQNGAACACGILERGYDFRDEAQIMAADNKRLCEITEAADKLAAAVKGVVVFGPRSKWQRERLERALQDYETVRQGQ